MLIRAIIFVFIFFLLQPNISSGEELWPQIRACESAAGPVRISTTVNQRIDAVEKFNRAARVLKDNRMLIENAFPALVQECGSDIDARTLFFAFSALGLDIATRTDDFSELIRRSQTDSVLLVEISNYLATHADEKTRRTLVSLLLSDSKIDWLGVRIAGNSAAQMAEFTPEIIQLWDDNGIHIGMVNSFEVLTYYTRQNIADAVAQSGFMPDGLQDRLKEQASVLYPAPLLTDACKLALAIAGSVDAREEAARVLFQSINYSIEHDDIDAGSLRYLLKLPDLSVKHTMLLERACRSNKDSVRRAALGVIIPRNDITTLHRAVQGVIDDGDPIVLTDVIQTIAIWDVRAVPIRLIFENFEKLDRSNRWLAFSKLLAQATPQSVETVRFCINRLKEAHDSEFDKECMRLDELANLNRLDRLVPILSVDRRM